MRLPLAAVCLLAAGTAIPASADVVTDGTVGPRVRLGGDFEIRADLGTRAGRNLFHSFERFSLAAGERATFSGPTEIRNVISRVTGGTRSDIDGTLRSTIPGADFYFLNPAGVAFGPNARLDLQGSFHVSTADELRFADGARFSARDPSSSSLTVAAPEAFGFLGSPPSPILVDRSALGVLPGESLSLVGGDITIDGGNNGVASGGQQGLLLAGAGLITLAAIGGSGEVQLASGAVTADHAADIRLADQAAVATSGDGGGVVRIRGGSLVMENQSSIFADHRGTADAGGGIEVDAEAVTIGSGSALTASALGAGDAGTVRVAAGELEVRDGGLIASNTHAAGDAGAVTINAGRLLVSGAGGGPLFTGISSNAEMDSTGAGGAVTVTAGEIEVRDGGVITGSTFGAGDAGTVTVTAGEIEVRDGGVIVGATFGAGDAGTVTVTAGEVKVRDGGLISSQTEATGPGGALTIRADLLDVHDGGRVVAISLASAAGAPGTIELRVGRLHVRDGGFVGASAVGQDAPAGDTQIGGIDIVADVEIVITGQGIVTTQTFGARPAGPIVIRTPVLRMPQFGVIDSSTRGDGGAGAILIAVDRLLMGPRAAIGSSNVAGDAMTSRPEAIGSAGTIEVRAAESIGMVGSAIGTLNTAAGPGGSVTIATPQLRIAHGGITTESTGAGNAGNIVVVATDRLELDDGSISAEAASAGGGRITIEVGELIDLQGSEIATSVAGDATTTAGDITLDPRFIVLDGSRIVAQAEEGRGGNIRITADNLILSPDSVISASAGPAGIAGTIVISSPEVDLSGGLIVLEGALLDAASQLRERCGARRDVGASSFTGVGRGGLPASPDAPLAGAYVLGQVAAGAAMTEVEPGSTASDATQADLRIAGLSAPCAPLE